MGDEKKEMDDNERKQLYEYSTGVYWRVRLFPGDTKEYERKHNYSVEIIDTKRNDGGVATIEFEELPPFHFFDRVFDIHNRLEDWERISRRRDDFLKYLKDEGIEALVNVHQITETFGPYYEVVRMFYGLPVRKARNT